DRLAACIEFATAVNELKRGVVAAWLRRKRPAAHRAAVAEADRLGSLAEAARFRLLLVSGQPEPLADAAFGDMGTLRNARPRSRLKVTEVDFEAAVSAFIREAHERSAEYPRPSHKFARAARCPPHHAVLTRCSSAPSRRHAIRIRADAWS